MLFFYLRHGDPIYQKPSSLTERGKKQAEALAKRLAVYGIDRIFSSPSNRAIMTAQPTCDLLKKEMTLLEFCHENNAWRHFTMEGERGRHWIYQDKQMIQRFTDSEIAVLSYRWYEHPEFEKYREGIERIGNKADQFFLSLGYEHEKHTGRYKVIHPNEERVALFAHEGFGLAFLSCVLDIPYPQFCTHFYLSHSGMTVIEFKEINGYAIPKVLTLSSDSHLYREGLPTNGF